MSSCMPWCDSLLLTCYVPPIFPVISLCSENPVSIPVAEGLWIFSMYHTFQTPSYEDAGFVVWNRLGGNALEPQERWKPV